jgi:hypothetical protein
MPRTVHVLDSFNAPNAEGYYHIYRLVYVSCGKFRCIKDKHGPYLYLRERHVTAPGKAKWTESYIGKPGKPEVDRVLNHRAMSYPAADPHRDPAGFDRCPADGYLLQVVCPYIRRCPRCGKTSYARPAYTSDKHLSV